MIKIINNDWSGMMQCNNNLFFFQYREPPVRQHLAKVYCCLTATTLAAALGAIIHLAQIWEGGFLSAIISLGLVLGIHFTQDNGKNFYLRLGMLLGFGLFTGKIA